MLYSKYLKLHAEYMQMQQYDRKPQRSPRRRGNCGGENRTKRSLIVDLGIRMFAFFRNLNAESDF